MSDTVKKRLSAVGWFAALLAVEILIGKFGGGFVRAYGGDVLVIPLIYCLVRIFYTRPNRFLPVIVGSIGIFAEVVQYFNFCDRFGIDRGSILGIMLGSVADIRDVICYAVGVIFIYLVEWGLARIQRKSEMN